MTLYPPNHLKLKLSAGEPALGFWLSTNSLAVTEIAAGAGWDWLLLDMEHVPHNVETVERHVLAAQHADAYRSKYATQAAAALMPETTAARPDNSTNEG